MLPDEKIVVISGYDVVSPRMFVRELGDTMVMGHGEFILEAILDIPLRPNVRKTETFTRELERGREKGVRGGMEF